MAKKKKPFKDSRGKWYHILGKKNPRPHSEKALRKALQRIEKAKAKAKEAKAVQSQTGDGPLV